ncbi:2-keto-4-pentenoate hydratase [Agromyces sp. Marseille-Q5079]|uniref:2-keto-4-pentenoate hydratase n=1 Tax=Agromyces sp. Marseille-Q5079 TaxID=3439059 RepID=UPI003D9C86D4
MSAVAAAHPARTGADVAALAELLDEAQRTATPVEQLSAGAPLALADAYAVQHALVARRIARGDRVAGLKLGFTSRAKARQMGVDDVILGTLTEAMRVEDGGCFDPASCIHPRVEPEVAYLLGADVDPDGGAHPSSIVAVAPALEIIDSRYRDFRFDLGDVVADDTSAAAFAIGPWIRPSDAVGLANRAVQLEIDGRLVQTGSTAAILGDPARALAAAGRLANAHGFTLRAGTVLLAGAATVAVPLPRHGVVEAGIHGLGRVSVRLGADAPEGDR